MAFKINLTQDMFAEAKSLGRSINDHILITNFGGYEDLIKDNPRLANASPLKAAMYERGIRGSTKIKDVVGTEGAPEWLLPAWISQTFITPDEDGRALLDYIRSDIQYVNSLSVNVPIVDFKNVAENVNATTPKRVAEGADIPVGKITVSENAIRLYKKGCGLEQTYEAIMFFTLDKVAQGLRRIAHDTQKTELADVVDVLVNGDGNNNAITAFSTNPATANKITAEELIDYCTQFSLDTGLPVDVIIAGETFFKQIAQMQYDMQKGFGASSKVTFITPQFDLSRCALICADVPQTAQDKNQIILANKANAISEFVVEDSIISEVANNIRNQTRLATFTKISGFGLFDKTARRAIVSK